MTINNSIYPHTTELEFGHQQLRCNRCGQTVSSRFRPAPNEISSDLVVRAWVECPNCIRKVVLSDNAVYDAIKERVSNGAIRFDQAESILRALGMGASAAYRFLIGAVR